MWSNVLPTVAVGGSARLTAGLRTRPRLDLAAHRELHGMPRVLTGPELLSLAADVHLRGRGGAAFPFAFKVEAVMRAAKRRNSAPVVFVIASEG